MTVSDLELLLAEIDALKTRLDALRPLSNARLQQALDVEYTYESNRIEGNTLTLCETDLVVSKGLTVGGKSLREHLEAVNHHEAIAYIRGLASREIELNEREVRNIHTLMLRGIDHDNAGRYRQVPVAISGSRHVPPQPWALSKLMEDYGLWLAGEALTLHPVVRAAEAHERLVTIHPFIDGNGRTARLAMNLILLKNGYPIANIPGDAEGRLAYYGALEKANTQEDKTPFLLFIVGQVRANAQGLLARLGINWYETLDNLSHLPEPRIDMIRRSLLDLASLLESRPSRSRDRVLARIAARIGCVPGATDSPPFEILTTPTPAQRRAFNLIEQIRM